MLPPCSIIVGVSKGEYEYIMQYKVHPKDQMSTASVNVVSVLMSNSLRNLEKDTN